MDVNYLWEVGTTAVMTGLFGQPTQGPLSTSVGETQIDVIGPGPIGIALGTVLIHPQATLAASDTNYWMWQVYKRTSAAPGTQVLIAKGSTAATLNNPVNGGGGLTAWKAAALTVQTGNGSFVSSLDVITVVVTMTGAPAAISYSLAGFTTIQ